MENVKENGKSVLGRLWSLSACFLCILSAEAAFAVPVSDSEITSVIGTKLFNTQNFVPEGIQVRSNQGVVTLTGTVSTLRGKQQAVQVSESVRGVTSVVDRLIVTPPFKTDDQLKSDVQTALMLDPTTSAYPLSVSARNGTVTISGNLDSRAEKSLAAWVASGVSGVKKLDNDIVVTVAANRSDAQIDRDVLGNLRKDPWINEKNIVVAVEGGKVILSGTVANAAIQHRAAEDAWVAGVKSVDTNALNINYVSAKAALKQNVGPLTDDEIKREITDAYLQDPRLKALRPEVQVSGGHAILTGTLGSLIAKHAAEEDARTTRGVLSVTDDQLKVVPASNLTDTAIASAIHRTLAIETPELQQKISVSVLNGHVTLNGKVSTPYQKWMAWDAASRVKGATSISDQVQVQASVKPTNAQIKKQVQTALSTDPFIDPQDQIQVSVNDGQVVLNGIVDSWTDQLSATQDAFSSGAVGVTNHLSIAGSAQQRVSSLGVGIPRGNNRNFSVWALG